MSRVRVAHLSDPHFGTIRPGVREGLRQSLLALSPDLVLITGDITQRARRGQFREAAEFCRSLEPLPVFALPGNHDIPLFNLFARLFSPYGGFRKHFQAEREMNWQKGEVRLTCLNSTSRWRHVQGDFNLERIRHRLGAPPLESTVHLVAFHHPMDCPKETDEKNLLKGRERAMALFQTAKADILLGGHIHDPYVALSDERYPHIPRRMVLVVAGTCLSSRIRKAAPNSFHLIDIESGHEPTVTVVRHDIGKDKLFSPRVGGTRRFVRLTHAGWTCQD